MSKTPFMPLWVSDFLGDTLDLDATEIGAYMLLLMAQWNREGKSLPDDDHKLRRIARCGRNWPKVWGVLGRFFSRDDGGIYSRRLRLEAQNVAAKREVNVQSGARGGAAKALKTKNMHVANATVSLQRNPSIPEPEPYIRKRETNVSLVHPPLFSAQDFADFWAAYPHRNGQKKNRKGAEVAFAKAVNAGATITAIADGVDAMRHDPDVARGYARDPTTWLNQRGWTDEIPANGGTFDKPDPSRNFSNGRGNRPDPALEQIARLVGLGTTSGHGRA